MRSINKVILVGNLTREPEMKETTGGQPITTFGLATNRAWVTRSGDKNQSAEFHELVAWGKLAEICHQFLRKGKLIYIEGYLKTRSWDNEDGTKRFRTEVVINDMVMLEKKSAEGEEILPLEENMEELMPEEASSEENPPEESQPEEVPVEKTAGAEGETTGAEGETAEETPAT